MRIRRPSLEASFVVRENRFRARVSLAGKEGPAHVPNSGRLSELLLPGRRVLLGEARAPHRVTDYDLLMVQSPETLVSVDARLTNRLFAEALEGGALPEFAGLTMVSPEFRYGESRLDFLLEADSGGESCVVEVKSVTLVQDGVGYFPDAVTQRGSRHLRDLGRARQEGMRAAVVFVIQREDARAFLPHDDSDPHFAELLRAVASDGVEMYAYTCRVRPEEIVLNGRVPVFLSEGGNSMATRDAAAHAS
ncbi:MAG: DNA/RNA nuclease SfsA [Anaerolineae bacterium]